MPVPDRLSVIAEAIRIIIKVSNQETRISLFLAARNFCEKLLTNVIIVDKI